MNIRGCLFGRPFFCWNGGLGMSISESKKPVTKLLSDESGAVTVDWVVLTGAVVAIAVGIIGSMETILEDTASTLDDLTDNARASTTGTNITLTD